MCCKELKYRGCIIYKNVSPKFGTYYFSIANPFLHPKGQPERDCHCHVSNFKTAENVIDCFQSLRKNKYWQVKKYPLHIRNKALRLLNTYVHECY